MLIVNRFQQVNYLRRTVSEYSIPSTQSTVLILGVALISNLRNVPASFSIRLLKQVC